MNKPPLNISFLSRVALITNTLFVYSLAIQQTDMFKLTADGNAIIIISGWIMAPTCNLIILTIISYGFLFKKEIIYPKLISIINCLFIPAQLYKLLF
ncbi:MAG: hypothetical protein ACOVNR_04255 [Chitinophagaceae bacterium]